MAGIEAATTVVMVDRRLTTMAALLGLGCGLLSACTAGDDGVENAEPFADSGDDKADSADLPLTEVLFDPPRDVSTERVGLINSEAGWRSVFGAAPPSEIDFSREWAAYYTPGPEPTVGYRASITRVRLSDSGATLKISTSLEEPGAYCTPAASGGSPYAIVKFAKPASPPSRSRYSTQSVPVDCPAPSDDPTWFELGCSGPGVCATPAGWDPKDHLAEAFRRAREAVPELGSSVIFTNVYFNSTTPVQPGDAAAPAFSWSYVLGAGDPANPSAMKSIYIDVNKRTIATVTGPVFLWSYLPESSQWLQNWQPLPALLDATVQTAPITGGTIGNRLDANGGATLQFCVFEDVNEHCTSVR